MKPKLVVAFGGQKQNGKGEAAYFYATLALPFLQADVPPGRRPTLAVCGFATPIKETVASLMGVSLVFVEQWKNNPLPPPGWKRPVRELLKFVGDGLRQWDDEVWIRKALSHPCSLLALDDLRYLNEARAVRESGGINVLLWRLSC